MTAKDPKRWHWLTGMIKEHGFTYGAEIGSGNGMNPMELLKRNPGIHLTIVAYYPNWKNEPCTQPKSRELFRRRMRPYRKRVEILWATSHEAAKQVEDESLDWIFIDANHTFPYVVEDVNDWVPKVRPGGLIAGHDFSLHLAEVEQAVRHCFGTNFETGPNRVWWTWKSR